MFSVDSATYHSVLFLNFVCLLRAILLYHGILGNVKMSEMTEAAFLPDWKENYNNISPAALQSPYTGHNCTATVLKLLYFKLLQSTLHTIENQLHLLVFALNARWYCQPSNLHY